MCDRFRSRPVRMRWDAAMASGDPTLRQLTLLRLIPRAPRHATASQLRERLAAQGFHVHTRTMQRDLSDLSRRFGITCNEGHGAVPASWFWPSEAAALDIPSLEPAAALAMLMARGHLQKVLPRNTLAYMDPYFARAEAVLRDPASGALGAWQKRIRVLSRGPNLKIPVICREVQDTVYDAMLRQRQLKVLYRGRGAAQKTSEQCLHPQGMVFWDGVLYLIATTWKYHEPYQYAVHRMQSAEVLEEPAKVSPDFDLDDYIRVQKAFSYPVSDTQLVLELRVKTPVAELLEERPLSADQTLRWDGADESVRVRATVADTSELRWWIRGFGSAIEVIKPRALRREFAQAARELTGLYGVRTSKAYRV